jgi:AAA+ superfamily predicted ATPase
LPPHAHNRRSKRREHGARARAAPRLVPRDAPWLRRAGREWLGECPLDYARNLLALTALADALDHVGARRLFSVETFRQLLGASSVSGWPCEASLARFLSEQGGKARVIAPPAEPLATNLATVASCFGLDAVARDILQFLAVLRLSRGLEQALSLFEVRSRAEAIEVVAAATGLAVDDVACALSPDGQLMATGLVRIAEQTGCVGQMLKVDGALLDLLPHLHLRPAGLLSAMVLPARPATCAAEDFAFIAVDLDRASRLLASALENRVPGANVLICGDAGAGKTELAAVVASAVGAPLHAAGTRERDGLGSSTSGRGRDLVGATRSLARARALLLVDDMEDLFDNWEPFAPRAGRAWFYEFLDRNPVPTIWTARDLKRMDASVRKRFGLVIQLTKPDAARRRALWDRFAGDAAAPEELDGVDGEEPLLPSAIVTRAKAARLIALASSSTLTPESMEARQPPKKEAGTSAEAAGANGSSREDRYSLDALNASVDLFAVAKRLALWKPAEGPFVMCLHGAPGTGKSEFIHRVARASGRRVLVKRYSDLETRFVGEAEQNLAAAFREATRSGAILLFDEVDSFLRERRYALQRHEVTMTNEFLQQLEAYEGILACTTNRLDDMDPAVLRRIPLKIELRPMDPDRCVDLLGLYFPRLPLDDEARRRLKGLRGITPGDFATVAAQVRMTGEEIDAGGVAARLAAEIALRERGRVSGRVGFMH